jgi:membrane-associated protease RseP (regulator of RpoE activity)
MELTVRQKIVPLFLFMVTLFTTLIAGALQQGINPFSSIGNLLSGFPFAGTLLAILLTHEFAHFAASRHHGIPSSLPYFIPAPPIIGTFGAFIRTHSPILNKKALFDIGVSGPLAGFVVAIVAIIIGLRQSEIVSLDSGVGLILGSPLLFSILSWWIIGATPEGTDVLLHPIAFAGWIGLFVTALNLLPIGQLDGGHISYAVFGRRHLLISRMTAVSLIGFGFLGWIGWFVWAVLTWLLGHGHPPTIDEEIPLDEGRRKIGWLSFAVLILCFVPVPFQMP